MVSSSYTPPLTLDRARHARMTPYTTHLDVAYPGPTSPRQALDLFLPPTAGPSSPLLVYVHGAPELAFDASNPLC